MYTFSTRLSSDPSISKHGFEEFNVLLKNLSLRDLPYVSTLWVRVVEVDRLQHQHPLFQWSYCPHSTLVVVALRLSLNSSRVKQSLCLQKQISRLVVVRILIPRVPGSIGLLRFPQSLLDLLIVIVILSATRLDFLVQSALDLEAFSNVTSLVSCRS